MLMRILLRLVTDRSLPRAGGIVRSSTIVSIPMPARLSLLVFLAGTAPSAAQEPVLPDFPARAELITVDVVVLGKDGRPIRGLKPSDFAIREDGKPQAIVGFEARDLAVVPAGAAAAAW